MATIDGVALTSVIDALEKRWDELRHYVIRNERDISDMRQRHKITTWLTSISMQIDAVRVTNANLDAAEVVVTPLDSSDRSELLAAVRTLNSDIKRNQTFKSLISTVTAVLGAADAIHTTAQKAASKPSKPAKKATKPATKSS